MRGYLLVFIHPPGIGFHVMNIDPFIQAIERGGYEVDDKHVIKYLGRGRFREEHNFEVLYGGERLSYLKVFFGRGVYRPWIEMYGFGDVYFKWIVGDAINFLRFLYGVLDAGESLFIEYYHDPEMVSQLERGVPIEDTVLGRALAESGFRRFKDWYIPEGMWEGGQKIEAWR